MSSLRFYNTPTRKLEDFTAQTEGEVKMYTCGPTVYHYLTVGNWTAYIYWDTLVRLLEANEYTVHRVMNITDVGHLTSDADEGEDKLEKGARRDGKSAWDVAKFYGDDFLNGMQRLNMKMPEHITKATEYIPQQLDLVRTLKQKGYTYQIDDGIYYDTSKFPAYADFAHLDVEAQKAGARVEFNQEKRNPSDFALWKFTPQDQNRDMEWDTPADLVEEGVVRKGFPGWHLECSAMAMSLLGDTLDIHTGGIDHIPVHHTNEVAQSEAASGETFSNYWIHCNHLKVNGTKISKSLGNGYTLDDLKEKGYDELDYRLFVLQSHYRTEGNFTFDNLDGAKHRRLKWRNIAALRHQSYDTIDEEPQSLKPTPSYAASRAIIEAMNDDLNTPEALSIIDEAFASISAARTSRIDRNAFLELLKTIDDLLGLRLFETTPDIADDYKRLILERRQARNAKNWARSDEIRDDLLTRGIVLKDTDYNTTWQYNQ